MHFFSAPYSWCRHTSFGSSRIASLTSTWLLLLASLLRIASPACGMTGNALRGLQHDTRDMFYHGFDSYMQYAFPEDEIRPIACQPLSRDRLNPSHVELNDVLGNYSLTLIDSLSTLAILASSPPKKAQEKALGTFQDGVKSLIEQYGDGTPGQQGQGLRARGFDIDSKVQVFETVIRGVGGLLSAHQFAVGDLPIDGYDAAVVTKKGKTGIHWLNGLVYNGQLLQLARDLAERLLPAFDTPTGLPYPRVNLRHGIFFYAKVLCDVTPDDEQCADHDAIKPEITETCSAGAGSLVLEFATLSRLTGESKYEAAAKKAFWAVWHRRSNLGLIGSGIDAESGIWVHGTTGIGAGIDSFFEYALKSSILLSGLPHNKSEVGYDSADDFLDVWHNAHAAIKYHIYHNSSSQHPYYSQVDLHTGALRANWIDALSAYYPGLLTLAGELEEAIEVHLLYTALWTRYSAIPERWSTTTGSIEHGLRWWAGRPEFIESTWYLFRATQDPWYLHIGAMVLEDIKRRCWAECGWAGLQDVRTGELMDRMESFFLGETAKYLLLLFDTQHPLNHLDAPFVFTTEGHPLIIPERLRAIKMATPSAQDRESLRQGDFMVPVCRMPPGFHPLTMSSTAARADIFHAANLARLHISPDAEMAAMDKDGNTLPSPFNNASNHGSPFDHGFYPRTLPSDLIPPNGQSSALKPRVTLDLSFPTLPDTLTGFGALQRVHEGVLIKSTSGLRLSMMREPQTVPTEASSHDNHSERKSFRIHTISNVALGRSEKVFLSRRLVADFNPGDPYFTRIKDFAVLDLFIDTPVVYQPTAQSPMVSGMTNAHDSEVFMHSGSTILEMNEDLSPGLLSSLLSNIQFKLHGSTALHGPSSTSQILSRSHLERSIIPGALPSGPGAAILPDLQDPLDLQAAMTTSPLPWNSIYVLAEDCCNSRLSPNILKEHQVLVIKRGGCSFSQKLNRLPSFAPGTKGLQLIIVVSFPEHENKENEVKQPSASESFAIKNRFGVTRTNDESVLIQPHLSEPQLTPAGIPRTNPIPVVMVQGGEEIMRILRHAKGVGFQRRWKFESQGTQIENLIVV